MDWHWYNGLIYATSLVIAIWMAGAIHFDVCKASKAGTLTAGTWLVLVTIAFIVWRPPWQPFCAFIGAFALFLCWWFSQKPSQHRNWHEHFSRPAEAKVNGDAITIVNVRNVEYRTIDDATTRFEDRTYRLSLLCGVDVLILNWGSTLMCHPMFIFDFGEDGRLCLSIEVRYRIGQQYSLLRSLYRQQELMYVASDERDAILRRTKCLEGHDLYLYRMHSNDLIVRQFLLEYLTSMNVLVQHPRWYHGLTTNCTTSIYAQGRGRIKWNWRMLVNGSLDRLMHERGILDQSMPFEQLKKQSWINEVANRAQTASGTMCVENCLVTGSAVRTED